MITLFLIYLAFQITYDHWATDTVTWKVIYFAFQYGWIAALALVHMFRTDILRVRLFYLSFALIMSIITVNELVYFDKPVETYAMMSANPPAFMLTLLAILFFLVSEIILKWRNR